MTYGFQKTIFKVIQGHSRSKMTKKGQKGQILNLLENSQIIPQNEAPDIVFLEQLFSRSFRVTQCLSKSVVRGPSNRVTKNLRLKKTRQSFLLTSSVSK